MPLTQEKRLDSNFSNNNDHNYLHKKFKKMASTMTVFPAALPNDNDLRLKETNIAHSASNSSITNSSIAAAHPEIERIKYRENLDSNDTDKNVQTRYNSNESNKLSFVNNIVHVSGQTSFTDEFSNKTETLDNELIREAYNVGTGGRYICPYCKLSCAKPSVLQKHIRAHTNERPYPCVPCGFAFKTKSNLYKHRRSRAHALRLQGADVSVTLNDEELSGGSESDTSIPPTSISDTGSEPIVRNENSRPNEFSSPELMIDSSALSMTINSSIDNIKSKTIYKPKFRAAFYQESDEKDKIKKSISQNADFLTEHISKIISDNEAIVDDIETPLQKKYGKIKQIAESKQFLNENIDFKHDQSPLNLTKSSSDTESSFRKRSHSEGLSHVDYQKHPLNPEGSIIKDLLLKTKANGTTPLTAEIIDGLGSLFACPVCQIIYRSAENLEVHRLYYCKGGSANSCSTITNVTQKDVKVLRSDNIFVRSNSVNVRLPETPTSSYPRSPPLRNKPDNLVILKQEPNDVVTPLPSPGPLLGNTRLVDTKTYSDNNRKAENFKAKPLPSPKRKLENRSETYSPRSVESISPRSTDLYPQPKIRCIETMPGTYRSLEDMSQQIRHHQSSLQMFGGEVKIVDHLGSTTTLRIEPSKNQLSPILIQQNLSPSRLVNDNEASSVVVRSGLHSGGTMVHNLPTPKDGKGSSQAKTPRNSNATGISNITHFQFPPLGAITAYNPLTLPPLSPSTSPSGASTILHGGKLIPHVPGMPGPNSPGLFVSTGKMPPKNNGNRNHGQRDNVRGGLLQISNMQTSNAVITTRYDSMQIPKSSMQLSFSGSEKPKLNSETGGQTPQYVSTIPMIRIKNVDEANEVKNVISINPAKQILIKQDVGLKRNSDVTKTATMKENVNDPLGKTKNRDKVIPSGLKTVENKSESEIRNFNFENLITKAEIYNQISSSTEVQKNLNTQEMPVASEGNERSETSYFQKSNAGKSGSEDRKSKFLRPSTLPLKPGTFTPKRHHGITPNANTMPLVSPETPRPAKAYGQLYLNGNAYTYLGLKCSTKVFYCTINRPQPTYVPNQHFLSMYSNWQLLSELTPDPLGLSASSAMSLYDSRHRPQSVAVAVIKQDLILTHSSQWNNSKDNKQAISLLDLKKSDESKLTIDYNATPKKELTGGFESNEEYTYVRGRGRGRYVCSECGIRCKKPSMLKKHIRTHTDVRPYTCTHCAFSFKTKGNLTKHMKSKAHYKKCYELGINPNEGNEDGGEPYPDSEEDTDSDGDEGNEGETESSDTEPCKSRLPEHEAAHCLLSLGGLRPATSTNPGLITSARPTTYPYTPTGLETVTLDLCPERMQMPSSASTESKMDIDNEPMDLSKSEFKPLTNIPEKIPTARESSVLASLASNTAKLPQQQTQWSNGEPMLHTYLTERALLDSKIKQSQVASNSSKLRKIDIEKAIYNSETKIKSDTVSSSSTAAITTTVSVHISTPELAPTPIKEHDDTTSPLELTKTENVPALSTATSQEPKKPRTLSTNNAENAKHVVSEYLKHARINLIKSQDENAPQIENMCDESNAKGNTDDTVGDENSASDGDTIKLPLDHDPIARKVVIGIGGVAFKVTKGKEFEGASYSSGRLMEDGRRVCDFCNKTFTKPSQLRLHLNIHYMERPFRCGVCAVSFRTRGHLQKHERSGSHHNKVSMTSTFGAATSFNPRPFRCSDCNIAFRIHGHLAKHLRSKMHVMRLECLFKLPFGTFTEIERAGVSLTDIDTTDCASSLASLQALARKLHEKDPSKLEFREGPHPPPPPPPAPHSSEDEEGGALDVRGGGGDDGDMDSLPNYSATDN